MGPQECDLTKISKLESGQIRLVKKQNTKYGWMNIGYRQQSKMCDLKCDP